MVCESLEGGSKSTCAASLCFWSTLFKNKSSLTVSLFCFTMTNFRKSVFPFLCEENVFCEFWTTRGTFIKGQNLPKGILHIQISREQQDPYFHLGRCYMQKSCFIFLLYMNITQVQNSTNIEPTKKNLKFIFFKIPFIYEYAHLGYYVPESPYSQFDTSKAYLNKFSVLLNLKIVV